MVGRTVDMTYPRRFREAGRVDAGGPRPLSCDAGSPTSTSRCAGARSSALRTGRRGPHGGRARDLRRRPVASGEVVLGRSIPARPTFRPHGMALIPESRKSEGLALIRTVGDNLCSRDCRCCRSGVMRVRSGRAERAEIGGRLGIAAPRAARAHAVGRQPAEGRDRQMAAAMRAVHVRRTDARHRCRRKREIFALIDDWSPPAQAR